MLFTYFSTVCAMTNNWWAIALLERPSAINFGEQLVGVTGEPNDLESRLGEKAR